MYVCMYVCIYVCMYVCMYVCIYIYIYIGSVAKLRGLGFKSWSDAVGGYSLVASSPIEGKWVAWSL